MNKKCSKCLKTLCIAMFYKNKLSKDGLSYLCKQCKSNYSKEYKAKNKEHIVQRVVKYRKNRLKVDPIFKLQKNIRNRINKILKQKESLSSFSLVGCSLEELKLYLENKFEPDMSWSNYGFRGWHVDHIVPLSSFNLADETELRKACHYTNLQPLWWKDNLKKNKY